MASAIIDPERLVIGTEDGLYCIDLDQLGVYCSKIIFIVTLLIVIFINGN